MRRLVPVVMIAGLMIAGCGGDSQGSAANPKDQDKVAAAEAGNKTEEGPKKIEGTPVDGESANPAVKAGDAKGDERYQLTIVPPDAAKPGEPGVVKVKVLPKGPWHMNHDYPTKLTVSPPDGVELAKSEQKKGDAIAFTDENCEFDVAFTSTDAGDKSFSGKFKFAICQDEACSPVQEDIQFTVAVK